MMFVYKFSSVRQILIEIEIYDESKLLAVIDWLIIFNRAINLLFFNKSLNLVY
jgi:hypothetical protein